MDGEVKPDADPGTDMEMFQPKEDRIPYQDGWNPKPGGVDKEWTWSSILKEVSEMYPGDLLQLVGEDSHWYKILQGKPQRIQMRYLVAATVLAALSEMPSPSLLNAVMDRMEGKIPTVAKSSDGGLMQITKRTVSVDVDEL